MESFGNSYHMPLGWRENRRDVTGRIDRIVSYCFINTARKTNFLGLCEKCESLIGSTRYAPISLFQKSRGERSRHSSFRQTLTAVFIFISPFSSFGIDSEWLLFLEESECIRCLKSFPSYIFFLSLYPTLLYTQTPKQHASCKDGGNQRGHSR